MGICTSESFSKYNCFHVDFNGEIKDITKDYLLKESIKEPLSQKYKIMKKRIGKGTLGNILLGIDSLGNTFAIKIIKKIKIINGQLLLNEIKIGSRMNHPHILKIKEVYEDKKNILFIMDYIEGGSLFNYITSSPEDKLNIFTTIDIIIQILEALDYLHNKVRICHRDIKPENFLITMKENKPYIKLIDFGLAFEIKKGEKMSAKLGTTIYMAPEVLQKIPYNEKIDMWSTGVLLFNMITGCYPFYDGDEDMKIYQILNTEIDFDVIDNEYMKDLCKNLLEKNPNERIDAKNALIKAKKIKKIIFGI